MWCWWVDVSWSTTVQSPPVTTWSPYYFVILSISVTVLDGGGLGAAARCNREDDSPLSYNDVPINLCVDVSYIICRIPPVWESNRNLQKKILLYCNLHVLMLPSRYKFQKIESRRSSLLAFLRMIPQDSMFSLGEVWYTHIDDPNE